MHLIDWFLNAKAHEALTNESSRYTTTRDVTALDTSPAESQLGVLPVRQRGQIEVFCSDKLKGTTQLKTVT